MVHHFFLLSPLRTLFGLLMIVGAIACFGIAVEMSDSTAQDADFQSAEYAVVTWFGPSGSGTASGGGDGWTEASAPAESMAKDATRTVTKVRTGSNSMSGDYTGKRPEWIDQQPHSELRDGAKVYVETVSAGPYFTDGECELAMGSEIDRAVAEYSETQFPRFGSDKAKLDGDTADHLVQAREYEPVVKTSFGPMREEHALLVFDPEVRSAIERQSRAYVAGGRLQITAACFGAVVLLLGGGYSLLKRKPA